MIDRGIDSDTEQRVSCKRPRDEVALEVMNDIENGANYGVIRRKYRVFCFWNRHHVLRNLRDHRYYKNNPDAEDPQD